MRIILSSINKLVLKSVCGYIVITASEITIPDNYRVLNEYILIEAEPITVLMRHLMI